ncbi:hypothetical protein C7448_1018 [Tenacibaculum gallaicum]|uniref:Lipoprotein n=1 Tax=Tenacibaculum gallaicum TaxID=561505 RepID=A0A3E0IBG2_9FLAO|nr:hypothetical protein [Tenacibaculum gallaicum]REH55981.1 hypothetical protein C7448_1018 [Tenacibaculum gallaicum]
MRTLYIFTIILGLISISCTSYKKTVAKDTSSQTSDVSTIKTETDQTLIWTNQPNSNSTKIKVLNAAFAFGSLPNGLNQMGYTIIENNGTYLVTNTTRALSDDVRVKAWVEGQDIILTSEVQQYKETEFGLPQPSGFVKCVRGNNTSLPDCWRTILVIANHLGGDKQYQ